MSFAPPSDSAAPASPPARVFGVVVHPERADARDAANAAIAMLHDAGVRLVGCKQDDWPWGGDLDIVAAHEFAAKVDVVLVFGGDGTFLRAASPPRDHGGASPGATPARVDSLSDGVRPQARQGCRATNRRCSLLRWRLGSESASTLLSMPDGGSSRMMAAAPSATPEPSDDVS